MDSSQAGDPDILTAEQASRRLRIPKTQTFRNIANRGQVPSLLVGARRRYSWARLYEMVAGPGVPYSDILTSKDVAQLLGVSERTVQRASDEPGTPGKLPGHRFGRYWRYALAAIELALAGDVPAAMPSGTRRS
jgi:hypothetical protein